MIIIDASSMIKDPHTFAWWGVYDGELFYTQYIPVNMDKRICQGFRSYKVQQSGPITTFDYRRVWAVTPERINVWVKLLVERNK